MQTDAIEAMLVRIGPEVNAAPARPAAPSLACWGGDHYKQGHAATMADSMDAGGDGAGGAARRRRGAADAPADDGSGGCGDAADFRHDGADSHHDGADSQSITADRAPDAADSDGVTANPAGS